MSNDNGNDFLTLKELAQATGYTTMGLRYMIYDGNLPYEFRENRYRTKEYIFRRDIVPELIARRSQWAVGARIKPPLPAAPPQSPDDFPTTQPPATAAANPDA